jgi:hypothetical protein
MFDLDDHQNFPFRVVIFLSYWIGFTLGVYKFNYEEGGNQARISKFLTYFFGILLLFGYPAAKYTYAVSMNILDAESKFTFSMFVANLRNVAITLGALSTYFVIFTKKKKLQVLLKKIVEFERNSNNWFLNINSIPQPKWKIFFTVAAFLNFIAIFMKILITELVVDLEKFKWYFMILLILPEFICFAMGNLYLLMILHIKYFVSKIDKILKLIRAKGNFHKYLQDVSKNYHLLFEINRLVEEIFTIPMLFVIAISFLSIMADCFYEILYMIYPSFTFSETTRTALEVIGIIDSLLHLVIVAHYSVVPSECVEMHRKITTDLFTIDEGGINLLKIDEVNYFHRSPLKCTLIFH